MIYAKKIAASSIAITLILCGCVHTEETSYITNSSVSYETTESKISINSDYEVSEETTKKISEKVSDSKDTISERKAAASESETVTDISSDTTNEITSAVVPEVIFSEETIIKTPAEPVYSETKTAETLAEETHSSTKKTNAAEPLNGDYLDFYSDSLFVGDSICSGLKVYGGLLDTEHVAARMNVASRSIKNYSFQYKNNSTSELDAASIVEYYQPKDIFIWMGMNDIICISEEKFAENMSGIAASYIELSPESRVHIVSISPMSSSHKWNLEYDGNRRINKYNTKMKNVCDQTDYIDFINIHDCLANDSGYLDSENDGGDGIHLSAKAYKKVLNEICSYMTQEYKDDDETSTESNIPDSKEFSETKVTDVTEVTFTDEDISETSETTSLSEETEDAAEETTVNQGAIKFREFFFSLKND